MPGPLRIPVSWPYNSRKDTAPFLGYDARRVNIMDEAKNDGSEGGMYTLKRPGMTQQAQFISGTGQALLFYNDTFFVVTADTLQSQATSNTGANGTTWVAEPTAPWTGRIYCQVVTLAGVMYLIGGLVQGVGPSSDVWWTTDGIRWTQATGAAPWIGRSVLGAVVQNGRIYVMGGASLIGTVLNDVWSSDNGTDWVQETAAAAWPARGGMGLVATSNGMFLMGGFANGTYYNDVWFSANGKDWTEVNVSTTLWAPREGMLCYSYKNKIFVVGGADASPTAYNDSWVSEDGGQTWTLIQSNCFTTGGLAFSGFCVYANKMWAISGEYDAMTYSDNVYSSSDGFTWALVTSNGPGAAVNGGTACVFAAPSSAFGYETMWFMGGADIDGTTFYAIPYYATLNVAPSTSNPLFPTIPDQPFQLASFVEGQKMLVKNQCGLWVYDHGIVTQVTDMGYPVTTVPGIVVLGGYAYVMDPTGLIRNCLIDDPYHWPSLNAVAADYADDPGVALAKYQNYAVAFGTYTTQFFYDSGASPGSPLRPYLNSSMLIGCANAATLVEVGNTLVWVSQTRQLHRQVVFLNGLTPQVISTPYIEKMLSLYSFPTAIAMSCGGHLFYVLNVTPNNGFPSFVYDFSTKNWYEWSTPLLSAFAGQEAPFMFPAFTSDFTARGTYVLTPNSGAVFRTSSDLYNDAGTPFDVLIQTQNVDFGNNRNKFFGQCEVIASRNLTNITNSATSLLGIEYSDDDYQSWSAKREVDLIQPRAVLYRNGYARRRAYRLTKSDSLFMRLEAIEQSYEQGE